MKIKTLSVLYIAAMALEIAVLIIFACTAPVEYSQDVVAVNEAVQTVERDWANVSDHQKVDGIDYTVIDTAGNVLFSSKEGLSESMTEAVAHGDTAVDITVGGETVGKLIVYNTQAEVLAKTTRRYVAVISCILAVQCIIGAVCIFYLDRRIIKPFRKLKSFAERVAGGNLDVPLEMDKGNIFGEFTESFDIMRDELKKARIAEAKANESKKELVAKLSHDIKTPVASIMAASEVGLEISRSEKEKRHFAQITAKAQQIDALVNNLFSATLEELQQLAVSPVEADSRILRDILKNADYMGRADVPNVPECLIYADTLRLQQVFDNIFTNSYKYADTPISVEARMIDKTLCVCVEDCGGGVKPEELPLLTEKYKRGANAADKDGAGLGLYISKYFMKAMDGELAVENGEKGLKVTVTVKLAGCQTAPREKI